MITAKPKIYVGTGLRVGNVPDDVSKLEQWASQVRVFDDHVGLQDFFLTSFRLKATWDEVKDADYMQYGAAYYWIIPKMLNENCAEITCVRDDLTTMGGPSRLEYIGGYITRAHPLSANTFDNVLEEPVGPANVLVAHNTKINFSSAASDDLSIVASTVKLDDPNIDLSPTLVRDALVFSSQVGTGTSSNDYTIAVPKPPAASASTLLRSMGKTISTVGFGLYDATNATVKKNLQYLRSIGLSDAILFSYRLPKGNISFNISTDGAITFIYGGGTDAFSGGNNVSVVFGTGSFVPKFKKTYLVNRSIVLRSRLSGDTKTFKPYEIMNNNNMFFQLALDPNYQGTSYCAPQYYYGVEDDALKIANSVKGLVWAECPISIGGATGSRWSQNELAANLRSASIGGTLGEGNLEGLAGIGLGGILTSTMGLTSFLNQEASRALGGNYKAPANITPENYRALQARAKFAQSQVQGPQLTSSPAFGLQNYISNEFDVLDIRPDDDDIRRIDKYFERYGYKQPNVVFSKAYLSSMPSFNYIEGYDIHIAPTAATSGFGREIIEGAEAALCGGCTIWHVKPNQNWSN